MGRRAGPLSRRPGPPHFGTEHLGIGDYHSPASEEQIREAFATALADGERYVTFCGETNYGNMEDVTAACQSHDIAYEHEFDGAGGEPPGSRVWHPGDKNEIDSEKGVIGPDDLQKLLDGPEPLTAIQAKIEELKRAHASGLPGLSASEEVKTFLAIEIARAKVTG